MSVHPDAGRPAGPDAHANVPRLVAAHYTAPPAPPDPALRTAREVLAANGVDTVVERDLAPLPTPVVSHAILRHRTLKHEDADGLVITPSHNPPGDGGVKY